jgi:hypothetical protein
MLDPFHEWREVQAAAEEARLDLIRTDLELCLTFATVAETSYSMGHLEHAERNIANAEKGYSDMLRFFSKANRLTPETEQELRSKFRQLRERLDGLQRRR